MPDDLIRLMHAMLVPIQDRHREHVWHPAVDVYRTRDGWLVKYDLAGVRREDVEVSAEGRRLTVRGQRRDCAIEEGCCCYTMEITYDRFERTLEMPCDLEGARIDAEHREGMLLVRIRCEEAQS